MGHIGVDVCYDDSVFIHPSAHLYGHILLGDECSVWPNVVIRSEMFEVRVGARTNIQDFVMIHIGFKLPTIIGEDCSITHHAILHGCTIGHRTLIGINATVMDGAVIGANSVVAGNAIVAENPEFPDNSIIAGVPAKVVATRENAAANVTNARFYRRNAQNYMRGIERMSDEDMRWIDGEG